jgi:acetoin utilization deacetylase AcuC-like enzyme
MISLSYNKTGVCMRKTIIIKDDLFLEHDPGYGHVESPERLSVIYKALDKSKLKSQLIFPDFEPAGHETLRLNHSPEHLVRIADTRGKTVVSLDPDTQTSARSFEAAVLAAGGLVKAVDMLVNGEADNGFALVRPPGHHAEHNQAMGFCLYNNVAIAAYHAVKNLGLNRVLIVDWDLHHGNGTQHSFYHTNEVFYFSTHQYPYYPGTGALTETGADKGEGFTLNIPLPGMQDDRAFARIFNEILAPVTRQYKPELILVSAGFDISQGDPLGSMSVTPAGFAYMTRVLQGLADEVCQGRLLLTLEGGYDIEGQKDGVMAVVRELLQGNGLSENAAQALTDNEVPLSVLDSVRDVAKKFWKL